MTRIEGTVYCDRCGVEISWSPYRLPAPGASRSIPHPGTSPTSVLLRQEYCCRDCAEDRPCRCAERMEIDVDEMG